jgi:hypothetical protein
VNVRVCSLLLVLAATAARAQVPESALKAAADGALQVSCPGGAAASGFVWERADRAVTALHVVAGCPDEIDVYFEGAKARRKARVVRTHVRADLAELAIVSPPDSVKPLGFSTGKPATNDLLAAVGFPLGVPRATDAQLRVRLGQRRLQDIVPEAVRADLDQHYPKPDLEILNLDGHLLPGMSGAPVVDAAGRVVGVSDGGLERGAASISWAIPAGELTTLATAGRELPEGAPHVKALFSADTEATVGADAVTCGGATLRKARRRAFGDLVRTSDDPVGLAQLARGFAMNGFDPTGFEYDIYEEARGGAVLVAPAGATLRDADGFCVAKLADGLALRARFAAGVATGPDVQFENDLQIALASEVPRVWQADLGFSYFAPMVRFDQAIVRRKAFLGTAMAPTQSAYLFETLAVRGQHFVGAAAVNPNACPFVPAIQVICLQAPGSDPCVRGTGNCREWARLALGIQLTSFSL